MSVVSNSGADHRSASDMQALSRLVGTVADHLEQAAVEALAAGVLTLGLMRCQLWLRCFVAVTAFLRREARFDVWLRVIRTTRAILGGDMARDLIRATADHIANGKDRVDPASAGGFNGRELAHFAAIFDAALQEYVA